MRKRLIRKGEMGELFGGSETIKRKERKRIAEELKEKIVDDTKLKIGNYQTTKRILDMVDEVCKQTNGGENGNRV